MTPVDWNRMSEEDRIRMKSLFNMLYILTDVCELYNIELSSMLKKYGYLRFQDKQIIQDAMKACRKVSKRVDTVCDEASSTEFGELSDELKELIEKYLKTLSYA